MVAQNLAEDVTIIMVPHEKFSCIPISLESLFANTPGPFKLVYVDGNSPATTKNWLREKLAGRPDTTLLRFDHYLAPMQARNLALEYVNTKYVAMVDDDVTFQPGWLEALYRCAEEEQADAVAPVITIGPPDSDEIHAAGGICKIFTGPDGKRTFAHHQAYENLHLGQVVDKLKRSEISILEVHCILARTALLKGENRLPDSITLMTIVQEFSLHFNSRGCKVLLEPGSRVNFIWGPGTPFKLSDLPFLYLTWGEKRNRYYLRQLVNKHQITYLWATNREIYWWMGNHRRMPYLGMLEANRRLFQRIKIPFVWHVIEKGFEYVETAFSYSLSEYARISGGQKTYTPTLFAKISPLWSKTESSLNDPRPSFEQRSPN